MISIEKELEKLSPEERKKFVVNEFYKCKDDFFYFVENYVYVRHPNKDIIKVNLFDFQYDIAYPIITGLKYGRTEKTKELLERYKYKFDFKRWMKEYIEKRYEELKEKIPLELEEYYTIIVDNLLQKQTIDTICLKSRQTGISTILQMISVWHCNFYPSKYHIIVSFKDKDAIKYLKDIKTMYRLLFPFLKSKKVKDNDHEFELIVPNVEKLEDGSLKIEYSEALRSRIICQTASEIRGDPPNLLVLDEFASYEKAEKLWESASFAVSGGGIIVIISTPKGVNNLYYKLWTMAKNTIISFKENNKNNENNISPFRLNVIHWTQLPEEEFKRRGFKKPIDWYNWKSSQLRIEGGEKAVAQELDLKFLTSGDTFIPGKIIEQYEKEKNILELKKEYQKISNTYIFEEPLENVEYIISCDVAKGVGGDYSVLYVLRFENQIKPIICLEFKSNNIDPDNFAEYIYEIYKKYSNDGKNKVWINIEQNNHGLATISYLLNSLEIDPTILLNPYDFKRNKFKDKFKGFETDKTSRDLMLNTFREVITELFPPITSSLFDEIKVFIDKGKKIEAQTGYHDDHIMAFGIGLFSYYKILPLYKQFLKDKGLISIDLELFSSKIDSIGEIEKKYNIDKKEENKMKKIKENKEEIILHKKISEVKNEDYLKIKYLSTLIKEDEIDDIFIF